MRHLTLTFILTIFLFSTIQVEAQKILQMEKIGSLKVKKYYIGDVLTFQLRGEGKYWFTEAIEDIYQKEGLVLFVNRMVKVEDIMAIRSFKMQRWSVPVSKNLVRFGISWGIFSLLGTLASVPLTWAAAIVPAGAFALAGIIRIAFKRRTFKIGKRRRLRLLDMDRESFFKAGQQQGP